MSKSAKEKIYISLKESRYFKDISDEAFQKLTSIVKLKHYEKNDVILNQGQKNHQVYCIVQGKVSVSVDNNYIYSLKRVGDIFGEMSVITGLPSNATIQAESPIEVVVFSANHLHDIQEDTTHTLHILFFKWFIKILTNKLHMTSQKAKLYETRSYELEQEHLSLVMSHRKLEEMHDINEHVLEKVGTLYDYHCNPMSKALEALKEEQLSKEGYKYLQHAIHELGHISDVLDPVASLYQTNRAIQKKKVLLAESNRKQQIIAKMALVGTGMELDITSSFEEGKNLLKENNYDLLCISADLIELATYAHDEYPEIQSVLVTGEDINVYLPISKKYPFLFVSRNNEDRNATLKNIITTVSKLISHDFFGLEKYLCWGIDVQQRPVVSSDTRVHLVNEMESYFKHLGIRGSVISKALMVAEELLMNAIYDAPIDVNGKSLYNHLPRTTAVVLPPKEQGTLRYACDGVLLAISVQDPFGCFKRDTILEYLEKGHEMRKDLMDKGGAGLGLFQIMNTIDTLVINVSPFVKTEVIAIFNVIPDKGTRTTSFHYFGNDNDLEVEETLVDDLPHDITDRKF